MSLQMVYEFKEFRKEIRDMLANATDNAQAREIAELRERLKVLENKYMALNARMGKRDG